jgi:hypothetical protein
MIWVDVRSENPVDIVKIPIPSFNISGKTITLGGRIVMGSYIADKRLFR